MDAGNRIYCGTIHMEGDRTRGSHGEVYLTKLLITWPGTRAYCQRTCSYHNTRMFLESRLNCPPISLPYDVSHDLIMRSLLKYLRGPPLVKDAVPNVVARDADTVAMIMKIEGADADVIPSSRGVVVTSRSSGSVGLHRPASYAVYEVLFGRGGDRK